MTIDKLFRDINSRLNARSEQDELFFAGDVLRAINDAVRELIVDAVKNKTAERLTINELVTPAIDTDHPYMLSATLARPILSVPDIRMTVYNVHYRTTTFNIATENAATSGQKGYLPGHPTMVLAVNDYSGGPQNVVFKPNEVRNFAPNDGGFYKQGSVIAYQGKYYQVISDFDSDGAEPPSANFTELFWIDTTIPVLIRPMVHEFHRMGSIAGDFDRIISCMDNVAFRNDKVYTTMGIKQLFVEYVPEWVDVTDPTDTVEVPAEWEGEIKRRALDSLRNKGIANADR
jgi:hypothetical protein